MKVVLLYGKSGSGKTTITEELVRRYPDCFNIIRSYTDRPRRYVGEEGHIFVSRDEILSILDDESRVVASTVYGDYFYCSVIDQFVGGGCVNLYVVDLRGVRDMLEFQVLHPELCLELYIVEVRREDISVCSSRSCRDVGGFVFSGFDKDVFFNDGSVDVGVGVLFDMIFGFFVGGEEKV